MTWEKPKIPPGGCGPLRLYVYSKSSSEFWPVIKTQLISGTETTDCQLKSLRCVRQPS